MTPENLKIPKFYQKENLFPSQIGTKLVIKKLDFQNYYKELEEREKIAMLKKRDQYLKKSILTDDGNNWKEVADASIKKP